MTEKLVIGVDGGGTSTTAWLANADGSGDPLGVGIGGGSNPHATKSFESAFYQIENAIEKAFEAADLKRRTVDFAILALAGCGRSEERERIEQLAIENEIADSVKVVSDVIPLLDFAATNWPAIALVSGTGSIGVGRDSEGNVHRSGGWGYLLGDEGSAFGIGVSALRAVAIAHDGRGPSTELTNAACDFFAVKNPAALVNVIYDDTNHRQTVARFASHVFTAGEQGDKVAQSVIESGLSETMTLLRSLTALANTEEQPFALVLSGGLFIHQPSWFDEIATRAKAEYPAIKEIILVQDPVRGATRMAIRELRNL